MDFDLHKIILFMMQFNNRLKNFALKEHYLTLHLEYKESIAR